MIEVPTLGYGFDALEPYIDARTMEIHVTRHHAGYVEKLNRLLKPYESLAAMDLEFLVSDINIVPEEIREGVRDNGGGHLNHSLFWDIMGPNRGGEPVEGLREDINSTFRGFSEFREEFTNAALRRFGSGWAWLAVSPAGRLNIFSTPNQDSPLLLGYRPILGIDVWEHAYYLKYQNHRKDYIDAWWNVVNWERVGELYTHHVETVRARTR